MTDPIADMLARTRNALMAKHTMVSIPSSKMKISIAKILKDEGFINDYRVVPDEASQYPVLQLALKYVGDVKHQRAVITDLKRVSKPGRRVYSKAKDLRPVLKGLGITIISTSRGVISDREARQRKLGGEVLCEVW
jgi:small subunit ribosomal protein S8